MWQGREAQATQKADPGFQSKNRNLATSLKNRLVEAMSEQLDSFAKLKKDVCSRLNEAAWKHLQKWACDPYRRECNEQWYLSKLRLESQYEELELADFRKDEEEEAVKLAALPEISDNEKARRDFGFGFLPSGM